MFVTKKEQPNWVGSGDVNLAFYKKGNSTIYISTFYQFYNIYFYILSVLQYKFLHFISSTIYISTFYQFYNIYFYILSVLQFIILQLGFLQLGILRLGFLHQNVAPLIRNEKPICSLWKKLLCDWEVRGHCMYKEMPVIPVNKVVVPKRIIRKNWGPRRRRGTRGCSPPQKTFMCDAVGTSRVC
jgi:hypothetical protein